MLEYLSSSNFPHICQFSQGKFIFEVTGEEVLILVGKRRKILSILDGNRFFDFFRNPHSRNRPRNFRFALNSFMHEILVLSFAAAARTAIAHGIPNNFYYVKLDRK